MFRSVTACGLGRGRSPPGHFTETKFITSRKAKTPTWKSRASSAERSAVLAGRRRRRLGLAPNRLTWWSYIT
jgi:hypothetical protein